MNTQARNRRVVSFFSPSSIRYLISIFAIVALLAVSFWLQPQIAGAAPHFTAPDPITEAWEKARAAGSYHFTSDIAQVIIPVAKITNVGRGSRSEMLHLEGKTDLRNDRLEMRLWSEGGSIVQDESGVTVKVEKGKTLARQGTGAWQEIDDFTGAMAPQGDFLGYLAALSDVKAHPTEKRAGITLTRYSFQIDGPRFAGYARDQIEASMRAKGELPPGVHIEVPRYYRDMTGEGELWIGADGLPLRQILNLSFPEHNDELVNAQITVNFSHFGTPPLNPVELVRAGDIDGLISALPHALPDLTGLVVLLPMLGGMALVIHFRRARRLQQALAAAVIFSLVGGPLLSTLQLSSFFAVQTAKAAVQTEQQTESQMADSLRLDGDAATEFDPHANPVAAVEQRAIEKARMAGLSAPLNVAAAAPAALLVDDGVDSDSDGLSNFVEERVGTDPTYADSDEDLIADNREVHGFELGGQTWYANALDADSNRDGIADTLEWDNNGNNQPDDSDGDGLPDLFDDDNDADSVPDRKDMAPFSVVESSAGFGEDNPFQLTINNLTSGKPTFVDFQVRPQNEQHLWFALNVLDWPRDAAGQVQDVDGTTFADFAATQGRTAAAEESAGDMKLVPMLEIRIAGDTTNLPEQADLTAYNVIVRDFSAGTKVVYVPLSIVTDEQTGQRVAFNGRMRYLPGDAWPAPHDVRLVWVVQALQDMPCKEGSQGCGADGYIHNVAQVIQSYYEPFSLTGLNVREEQGNASVAIIYEDPAVDSNKKDDAALWALSHGLDNSFLAARDQDGNGQRDVDLAEIERRFDHLGNSGVSDTQRWAVPNVLRVERQNYDTFDQAMIYTAMTETKRILDTTYNAAWQSDNTIKPLLMYAHETSARALGLDGIVSGGDYVVADDNGVILDMAPEGQPQVSVDVTTGLKWTPYCAPAASSPLWDTCAADDYWNELALRHEAHVLQPGDPNDVEVAAGRMIVTQLYALSLMQSIQRVVQRGNQLVSSRYSLKSDAEVETTARLAGIITEAGVPGVANIAIMARYVEKISVLKYLKSFLLVSPISAGKDIAKVFKNFTAGGHLNRLAGTGIVAAGAALIGGLAAFGYFFSEGELGAKITLKVIIVSIITFLNVISPIMTVREIAATFPSQTIGKLLLSRAEIVGNARSAGVIGAVIGISITWGFFIYSMVSNNVTAFSPEFNQALAETIAATIYLILLTAISATVIGGILVGIVAAIDAILTAVCELGVDALRTVPGLDGACFTIGNAAIKILAYLIYNYDVMIDTSRKDLVVLGSPTVSLVDQAKGFVEGNDLTVNLPVTTTVVHKNPDPENGLLIYYYLWLFSKENLKSSTVRFSLTTPFQGDLSVSRDDMTNEWQNVSEDHKFVLTPMYRGQASVADAGPVTGFDLQPGLNRRTPFYLNLGYALPAYECWYALVPVCYTRDLEGTDSTKIDVLQFDIFPDTLDEFMTLADKGDGGRGLEWDAAFPSLYDADGDGLRANIHGGVDPNDASPDNDGDGLTDAYELERRAAGVGYETGLRDTDADGLTDYKEMQLGTNPAVADSDNDGLKDGEEVWHQRYDPNSGAPTTTWEGGWDVTVNSATPFTVRVSSDPNDADADGDGVGDQAERSFALDSTPARRVDNQNRPYHPGVFNTPPIALYTTVNDTDGFMSPGQSFIYTTTVVAHTPLAPGVLNVTVPSALGSSPVPYSLAFDPLTFSTSQTVTQQTQLAVASGAIAQTLPIRSTVSTRLPASGAATWAWEPLTEEPTLPTVAAPKLLRATDATITRAESQDSYLLSALTSDPNLALVGNGGSDVLPARRGDVLAYAAPSGQTTGLDIDTDSNDVDFWNPARLDNQYLRGPSSPNVACNNSGNCMVVWDNYDFCNTVTINSITVQTAGGDGGSGIEPIIYFVRDGNDHTPSDGGYELLWDALNNGGNDMGSGASRGPNGNGFPITRTFCGRMHLDVYELDGGASYSSDPSQTDWNGMELVDRTYLWPNSLAGTSNVSLISGQHSVVLNLTIPFEPRYTVAGVMVNAAGTVQRSQFSLSSAPGAASIVSGTPSQVTFEEFLRPVVATDGVNFLVAWEKATHFESGSTFRVDDTLIVRRFDANGLPLGSNVELAGSDFFRFSPSTQLRPYSELAVQWVGDRYRITRLLQPGSSATVTDSAGQSVTGQRITKRDVSALGTYITGSLAQWADGADTSGTHDLAYDPITNRTLLVYRAADGSVQGSVLAGDSLLVGPVNLSSGASALRPRAAYHPATKSWLISSQNDTGTTSVAAWNSDLSGLFVPGTQPQFPSNLSSNALACPAVLSMPVVDLRFEELPGATSFADSSGNGTNASCTGASCPAAGVTGAPNAPLSDYALQFDGADDLVTLSRTIQDEFSIAFWLKAPNANTQQMLVDGGANQTNGFHIWLNNGALALNVPGANGQASGRIDDGQWHFIAITRNRSTGNAQAYVDGNRVINVTGTANLALNALSALHIGKSSTNTMPLRGAIDHVQIFRVVLSQNSIQGIYNRTQQSYCLFGGADTDLNQVHWARLRLTQLDTRGGRISASDGLTLTVDTDAPSSSVTSPQNGETIAGNQTLIIGGTAADPTSGIAGVEVSVNNGPWQAATGADSWTFSLQVTEGAFNIRSRATDVTGNVETPGAGITVQADAVAPQVTLSAIPATPIVPQQNAELQWSVALSGTATDAGSGVAAQGVVVHLQGASGEVQDHGWQPALLTANNWIVDYTLVSALADPTGTYTVTVRAVDKVGNRTADNAASGTLWLDSAAPIAALSQDDVQRLVISDTLTLSGLVTDTAPTPGSSAGLDKLEIAFTPVEQVASLSAGTTADLAVDQLEPTWHPVTLAQRGAGVANSSWSFAVPEGLEGEYQIDLRAADLLGNEGISANVWRGVIDNLAPRVVMVATTTGSSYVDDASGTTRHETQYQCAAVDRNLSEEDFVCPGEGVQPPARSFDEIPVLQELFPDRTIRSGLAISYTMWESSTTPAASASACDSYGNCTTASTPGAADSQLLAMSSAQEGIMLAAFDAALPEPGAPQAVIVGPADGSFVAAGNGVSVTVAAEAGALLDEVTISLDGIVVQTLSFAQSDAVTRTLRTVNVPIAGEGQHTLVASARDRAGATQATPHQVTFMLDHEAPSITIDASALTVSDTWQLESGILRFRGTVDDGVGVATVQIREGENGFVDANFGDGTWQTALVVQDPEGRMLTITVRAIDRAGRITEIVQEVATELSAADAPDTSISSGPANPSSVMTATFVFSGSATAASFDCQLDNGVYSPCASPAEYADLSKGEHTLRVRAIDGRGFADLSPAEYTWTVSAGQPDATIADKPSNPTIERTAIFTFTGDATAASFECTLDGSPFAVCTSPVTYSNLGDGEHTFMVRARNSASVAGAADRYIWIVTNAAPVAADQSVVVIPNQAEPVTLSATDSDPLIYKIVTPPAHGVLLGVPPNLTYVPDTGFGGIDSFTFRAIDNLVESNLGTVTLLVDNIPPVVTCSVSPNRLWPPNHNLINIQASVTVTDLHSGPNGFTLISVTSSEADSGLDKDDVPNDIQGFATGTPDTQGQLRAERTAKSGRLYTLTYEGKDVAGNVANCATGVFVPHNQNQAAPAVTVAQHASKARTEGTLVAETASVEASTQVSETVVETPAPEAETTPEAAAPETDESSIDGEAQVNSIFMPLLTNATPPAPQQTEVNDTTDTTESSQTDENAAIDSGADQEVEEGAAPTSTIYLPVISQ